MTAHEEVANLLRQAIRGEIDCESLNYINWYLVNEPTVTIGAWEITFFIEANWINDIYDAKSPDGRFFEFSPAAENSGIELFLNDEEVRSLCLRLGATLPEN